MSMNRIKCLSVVYTVGQYNSEKNVENYMYLTEPYEFTYILSFLTYKVEISDW